MTSSPEGRQEAAGLGASMEAVPNSQARGIWDDVRPVSHDEAVDIARRLISGSFRRDGEFLDHDKRPHFSIPTRVNDDDDCLILGYIAQQRALIPAKPAVEVVEALKPFAAMADSWAEDEPDDTVMEYHSDDARITLGDCRDARAALSTAIPAGDGVPAGMVMAERERCAAHSKRLLSGYDTGDDGFGVEEAIRSGRDVK